MDFSVRDLAVRFSDGRLSTEKLLEATDEQLSEMLIEIYGVGKVGPTQHHIVY
jgi:DNA-3-methyladenine glycosylase II